MTYPSIITQPGASARNIDPILEALRPLLQSPSIPSLSERLRILEIGSYPYEHITKFAEIWPSYEWWGSGRDEVEVEKINRVLNASDRPVNLRPPIQLDIGVEDDWTGLSRSLQSTDAQETSKLHGIVMINIIHCTPLGYPEHVFKHFSQSLGCDQGWIAAYSPFLNDDGSYRSEADEQFDRDYIKSKHASLGLRTISSIDEAAMRWRFKRGQRREMPKGNTWIVWYRQ